MIALDVNGTIGRAVASYCGGTVRELVCILDPEVPGTFGLHAEVAVDGVVRSVEFLLRGVPLHKATADDLEEVVFALWPPEAK